MAASPQLTNHILVVDCEDCVHPHVPEGAVCRWFAQQPLPCSHIVLVTSHYQQDHWFKSTCSQPCNCTCMFSLSPSIWTREDKQGEKLPWSAVSSPPAHCSRCLQEETHMWGDSDIALLQWTGEGFFVFNHRCSLKASEKCLLALDMTREHLASLHLWVVYTCWST